MLVDLLKRRARRRDHLLLTCQAIVSLIIAMITTNCSMRAADTLERRQGNVERELSFASRVTGESRPLVQRRSVSQQILAREPRGNERQHSVVRVHVSDTTGASTSPLPRRAEKSSTPPFKQAEKEQLFRDFLQWRKQQGEIQ